VVGTLMVVAGLGLIVGGTICEIMAVREQVATLAGLEAHEARLTRDVLLIAGGVFACAAGVQLCIAARYRRKLSRLGRVLFVGGSLLVAVGLAVVVRHNSIEGFYVGLGLQMLGATLMGIGGNSTGVII